MIFEFHYRRQAEKIIEKNSHLSTMDDWERAMASAIRKIRKIEVNSTDVIKMTGAWEGHWRVRIGSMRAIFRFEGSDVVHVFVERVEFRGKIYHKK